MKIVGTTIVPYRLPLRQPLPTRVGSVREREGQLVCLRDDRGEQGWGDVVTWPGFGSEPSAVQVALAALPGRIEGLTVDGNVDTLAQLADDVGRAPEVVAATEQALLDLLGHRLGLPLHRLLGDAGLARVTVHRLVGDACEATAALRAGVRALKIKVGIASVAEDIARVTAIRRAVGPELELRVDVNAAWDVLTACGAARCLADVGVDWLEEPVAGGADALAAVRRAAPIRIAADESVSGAAELQELLAHKAVDGVTLKPAVLGGLSVTRQLAETARRANLAVCLTHTFDSVIGRSGVVHLAAGLGLDGPHGLEHPFATDLATLDPVCGDQLSVSQSPGLGVTPALTGTSVSSSLHGATL